MFQMQSMVRLRRALTAAAAVGLAAAALSWPGAAPAGANLPDAQISGGTFSTCAIYPIKPWNRLYCWGSNSSQQGGFGGGNRVSYATKPYPVKGVSAPPVGVSVASSSACAVVVSGRIGCWGKNKTGALGAGNLGGYSRSFQNTAALTGPWAAPSGISAGTRHLCFRDNDAIVKCLGNNSYGQLGNGGKLDSTAPVAVSMTATEPTGPTGGATGPTPKVGARTATQVVSGSRHSCMLMVDGDVRCWGVNTRRQLGDAGDPTPIVATPTTVPKLAANVKQLATQGDHTCALHAGGKLSCWGANSYGQLGDGTIAPYKGVVGVDGLGADALQVTTGFSHSCALLKGGLVKCWGSNEFGQLGDGSTKTTSKPVSVIGLPSPAIEVTAGGYHSCARLQSGSVFCWGRDNKGQLGDGSLSDSPKPRRVQAFGGVHFAMVSMPHTTISALALSTSWSDLRATVVALPPRAGKLSRQCHRNAHLTVTVIQAGQMVKQRQIKRFRRSGQTKCTARFVFRRITMSDAPATVRLRGSYKGDSQMPAAALTEDRDLP